MKHSDFTEIGYPSDSLGTCIGTLQRGFVTKVFPSNRVALEKFREVFSDLEGYKADPLFGELAAKTLASLAQEKVDEAVWGQNPLRKTGEKLSYARWGDDIEEGALKQMEEACKLPPIAAAALMPDGHLGFFAPIGAVLAAHDAVMPLAVGVDIACRVKLTFTDLPVDPLDKVYDSDVSELESAIQRGSVFGVGGSTGRKVQHPVLDKDWKVTPVTAKLIDKAWDQLGTSGSGNHWVSFGVVELFEPMFGLAKGRYVALTSHSGSRGSGATVCKTYHEIAQKKLPKKYSAFHVNPWLPMSTQEGQEYFAAMTLMGDYAHANHEVIHQRVLEFAGAKALGTIENHHNYLWIEEHNGQKLYVHRKGATPAGPGVLGMIPGTMADWCYLVRGKGNVKSLWSASHGAGRRMSRTKAKEQFKKKDWDYILKQRGVKVISAGIDEMPGAYKQIEEVMKAQSDLVEIVGRFMPRLVKMADDGTNED